MPAGPRLNTSSPNRLNRICAAPPPEAHPIADQRDPEDQRRSAHVAQAFGVFVPRTHHFVFGQRGSFRPEVPALHAQPRNARRRKHERQGVEGERPLVAELHDAGAAEERPDGQRHPLRGLRERIRGVQLFLVRDGRKNGRAPAGEKRRGEHQQRAQQIEQPGIGARNREDESDGDHGADQVARDHDAFAVQPVEHHARDRSRHHGRDRARKHDAGDHQARARVRERQAKTATLLKWSPISLTTCPRPGVAIVPVGLQELKKLGHLYCARSDSLRTVMESRNSRSSS